MTVLRQSTVFLYFVENTFFHFTEHEDFLSCKTEISEAVIIDSLLDESLTAMNERIIA